MRVAYALATYLLLPVYAAYWCVRAVLNPSYRPNLAQRFGLAIPEMPDGCLWVHAVSVGEVQASMPLVHALLERLPHRKILFTTVTPTGAARARSLFGDRVTHCYVPFETPAAVRRFFDAIRPRLALIMETEIWPNLYRACRERQIPLAMVSARISPRSEKRYRLFRPLFREALSSGILIAAQSHADAARFLALGASPERTSTIGNIKFDIEQPRDLAERGAALRREQFGDRPVWIAASTHEGEEEQVLAAHRLVLERLPDALLVLVPRHPQRFAAVAALLARREFHYVARTSGEPSGVADTVFLGDTMGELPLFYAASDVAFVGGTLVPVGGHNLLEPGALGLPVVTGPHLFNTEDIAEMFTDIGAACVVGDAAGLGNAVAGLLADESAARAMGAKGREIVAANRGALRRLLELLAPYLEPLQRDSGGAA